MIVVKRAAPIRSRTDWPYGELPNTHADVTGAKRSPVVERGYFGVALLVVA
jgi:hypothetical protein